MDRNIQERISAIVDTLCGKNKSEFCRHIGRKADAIKDIIGGSHNAPSFSLIYDILSSDLGISADWLILGVGDMTKTETPKCEAPQVSIGHIQTVNIGNWGELIELLKTTKQ